MAAEFEKMISLLLGSQTQAHVYHLQTKSFAEHMALNGYYDNIIDLVDGLIESYQGKNGIIDKYTSFELNNYKSKKETINYFTALQKNVDSLREDVDDSYIQNQIDTVTELIQSTIYKLSYLA